MRVLVVDDSVVFRSAIKSAIESIPGAVVAGSAANGRIALEKLKQLQVDLVTLDMEMPELDGMDTLKLLRAQGHRQKVIVFSSMTQKGAERAIDALRIGADEVVGKPVQTESAGFEGAISQVVAVLGPILQGFMKEHGSAPPSAPSSDKPAETSRGASSPLLSSAAEPSIVLPPSLLRMKVQVLALGSSTGGPMALERFFEQLKGARPPFPIVLCQHMPPVFTASLAKRLEAVSGIPGAEGRQGEALKAGQLYVAPGDYHMVVVNGPVGPMLRLHQGPSINSVRPAVDPLFESAAEVYGGGVLGIVFTGMGADGAIGAERLRAKGGRVLIQDQASCVVYGMPGAVAEKDAWDGRADPVSLGKFVRRFYST